MLFHRDILRQQFLKDANAEHMHLDPMHQDASFRRYFRLSDERNRRLLMDAPPPQEDLGQWIDIASHLAAINLRPPKVFKADQANGFALIEDFAYPGAAWRRYNAQAFLKQMAQRCHV